MPLPAVLNEDTIAVFLNKQLHKPLTGDAHLHLLAGMPLRVVDLVPATITSAMTATGHNSTDITKVTTLLTQRKASK